MKRWLSLLAVLLVTATLAGGQPSSVRIVTFPRPPSREVLDRVDLRMSWKTTLPLQGRRDGLFSVQILDELAGPVLAVQSLSGALILLDGETGDLLWRVQVDDPFVAMQAVGSNGKQIFVNRRDRMYVLDRGTGRHLVWDVHRETGLPHFGFKLEGPLATAPVADFEQVYAPFENKVTAFALPPFASAKGALPGLSDTVAPRPGLAPTPQPERTWSFLFVKQQIMQPPIVDQDSIWVMTTDGTLSGINKHKQFEGEKFFEYKVHGPVHGTMARVGDKVYAASDDFFLYAFDLSFAKLQWRHSLQAPIHKSVQANDRDVFVVPERLGLMRVERASGRPIWSNRDAQRLVAANDRFVYAADRHENLLILDYLRGTTMAKLDTRDYVVPVTNTLTDRFYLANHDGQILCLHHRDQIRPLRMRESDQKPILPKPKEDKKDPPPEIPPDKEKDKDKDKIDKGSLELPSRSHALRGNALPPTLRVAASSTKVPEPTLQIEATTQSVGRRAFPRGAWEREGLAAGNSEVNP